MSTVNAIRKGARGVPTCRRSPLAYRPAPRAGWGLAAAAVAVALLLISPLAGRADDESGDEPDEKSPRELLRNETFRDAGAAAWEWAGREASRQDREDLARLFWETSFELDPSRTGPAFRLASSYAFSKPRTALRWLVRGLRTGWMSFGAQYVLTLNVLLLAFGAFLVAALFLLLIWTVREMPVVHHGIRELLNRAVPGPVAAVGAGLVLALPLIANLGVFAAVAVPLAVGMRFRGKVRRGVYLLLPGIVLSPLLLLLLGRLAGPADPLHPIALTERAQRGSGSHHLRLVLDRELEERPGDPLLRFARSWLAYQQGDTKVAEEDLSFLEARGGIDRDKVLINRAALDLARGRSDDAMERLLEAREIAGARGAISYNLALAHSQQLDLQGAQDELVTAQELDPERVREADRLRDLLGKPQPIREPIDNSDLWTASLRSGPSLHGLPLPGQLALLFPGGNPWLLWPALLLVGVIVALVGPAVRGLRLRSCSRCRGPICRRCVIRVGFRALCRSCGSKLRSRGKAWERRLAMAPQFSGEWGLSGRVRTVITSILGLLLPGMPQALENQNWKAFFYLFGAGFLWITLLHGGAPVPGLGGGDPVTIFGLPGLAETVCPAFLLILGVASAMDARKYHRRHELLALWIGQELKKAA